MRYEHTKVEKKWQKTWEEEKIYQCQKDDFSKPKYYALGMWPYPSGNAHMGHVRVYTLTDIAARYHRMKGENVINPIGWDAFGLPAENAAKKHGVDPAVWTNKNIDKMRNEQLSGLGFSFDWTTEVSSASPEYYKWTQWFFTELFKRGYVERRLAPCNYCPDCQTVLANEQVIGGLCWRCKSQVEQKEMEQLFISITKFADELYEDLDKLSGWPQAAIQIQKEWIGKKEGTLIDFKIGANDNIQIFTTRADTLFGVSALVLSFGHPDLDKLVPDNLKAKADAFIAQAKQQTELEVASKEDISGLFLDIFAEHPLTKEKIPVYIGDYVLAGFGTGAVMCVPAHDVRDFRFAKKYNLPIKPVVMPAREFDFSKDAYTEEGILKDSMQFSGLTSEKAISKIATFLEKEGKGQKKTFYRLKDWCISRQRIWGAPIPLKKVEGKWTPLSLDELPFTLEQQKERAKTGLYETETMDTFMCSSWYFCRFFDPHNDKVFADKKRLDYWMPIDFYVGAIEHAAQHLIYARFICKFLHKEKFLKVSEPALNYLANGFVKNRGEKMSKSKGNEVVPTDVVKEFGADALRMFILSDTPPSFDIEWNDSGLEAKRAFLDRIYRFFEEMPKEVWQTQEKIDHPLYGDAQRYLFNISEQFEKSFAFHNTISEIHSFFNLLSSAMRTLPKEDFGALRYALKIFLIGAAPIVPFLAEELYRTYIEDKSIHFGTWPKIDLSALAKKEVTIAIQINGKLVETLSIPADLEEEEVLEKVITLEKVQKRLDNRPVIKRIFVKNKILNLVVKP